MNSIRLSIHRLSLPSRAVKWACILKLIKPYLFICCSVVLSAYILLFSGSQISITSYLSQAVLVKCHQGIALSAADFHLWTTEDAQTQEIFWVASENPPWCPIICCLSKNLHLRFFKPFSIHVSVFTPKPLQINPSVRFCKRFESFTKIKPPCICHFPSPTKVKSLGITRQTKCAW